MYQLIGYKKRIHQNILLLLASYVFYGLWDWRFLSLLIGSTLIDYFAGKAIQKAINPLYKKGYLWFSIIWNLGILITFKYFNFFLDSFYLLFGQESAFDGYNFWNVVIPLGLSFYTFQTMSYTIDVYKGRIPATDNLLNFSCFVSFFPQLVAGPIERAGRLLPQFEAERGFDLSTTKEGLRQILWGLFKKILVADKIAVAVNLVFANPHEYGWLSLGYAAILFAFQVYCDFSAYSDIAIGTAKLFGFKLSRNFKIFYLSKSLTELWRGWHITLTGWFTDYVYIPLVKFYRQRNWFNKAFALLVTMFLIGLWHGANWTFIAFGLCNGIVLVLERIPIGADRRPLYTEFKKIPILLSLVYTFSIYAVLCVFFRSESLTQAFFILERIFSFETEVHYSSLIGVKLIYLIVMIVAEISTRKLEFPFQNLDVRLAKPVRWMLYYLIIFFIIRYAEPKEAFIYFQF